MFFKGKIIHEFVWVHSNPCVLKTSCHRAALKNALKTHNDTNVAREAKTIFVVNALCLISFKTKKSFKIKIMDVLI